MKNLSLLFAMLFTGIFSTYALNTDAKAVGNHHVNPAFGYGNSFIFMENDITFSVYPDGEFDFYVNNTPYAGSQVNISFNAGYDYNNYLQYDDYGAVIQVLNTPVFYDYYGRVSQIGSVRIHYNNRRLIRIGGLQVFYNPYGVYSHCSGYINVYNRVYVYRPFHRFFVRPVTNFCMVSYQPYREYYMPVRYTYYRPYRNNIRTCYANVGATYYYKKNNSRRAIYKNDRRVSISKYSGRTSRRGATQEYSRNSRRSNTQGYSSNSRRGHNNSYDDAPQRSRRTNSRASISKRSTTSRAKVSKRSTGTKKRNTTTTQVKKDKAPSGKTSSRSAVKHSPSKRTYKKATYTKKSTRNTKAVRKSSSATKRTSSKTRGRSSRSRT